MRRPSPLLLLATLVGTLSFPALAEAQVPYGYGYGYRARIRAELSPVGLYGGISLLGNRVLAQEGGPEQLNSGGGFNLFGGLQLSERLSLELGWMESFHNPSAVSTGSGQGVSYLVLDGVTVDARVHFPNESAAVPFVEGGVGVYALGSHFLGLDSIGTGFQLGGGLDYWLGDFVTLGVRALYRGIAMGPPNGGANDTFVNALTLEGSVGLHY